VFNMFEELFAPGRKHTNEERKRLELTRVDLNDGDPGRGPIDLSSGKVVVRPPGSERTTDTDQSPAIAHSPVTAQSPATAQSSAEETGSQETATAADEPDGD